jgi:hypothetical protein
VIRTLMITRIMPFASFRSSASWGEAILNGQHRRVSILWAGLLYNYFLDLNCFASCASSFIAS